MTGNGLENGIIIEIGEAKETMVRVVLMKDK